MSPRASCFIILVTFSGTAASLVVATEYYWDLLRKNLFCKCMGLVFAMGQDFSRKLDLAKNKNLEKNDHFCAKNSIFSVLETHSLFLLGKVNVSPKLRKLSFLHKNGHFFLNFCFWPNPIFSKNLDP